MSTRIGRSYKQHGIPDPGPDGWDAIVIGSGLGGLTAASMLGRHAGKRVLVLERHYTAGGFTHTFHRPGYEWDVGVHYVGDVHRPGSLLRRAFDHLTDGELAWADMGEVYDTIVIGDDRYELVAGRRNFRERMHAYFPHQHAAIDRYLDLIRATVHKSRRFFLEKALPPALGRLSSPALRWPALRDARRTVKDVLAELTDDPRLAGVLATTASRPGRRAGSCTRSWSGTTSAAARTRSAARAGSRRRCCPASSATAARSSPPPRSPRSSSSAAARSACASPRARSCARRWW
jgi:all-trans-retinol 13,14-reductase